MYNLWLDDNRKPDVGWVWMKDYNDFTGLISVMGNPRTMSLDHDLEEHSLGKNGYDCVRWYCDWLLDTGKNICKKITIHSMNPAGAENMESYLKNFCKHNNNQHCKIIVEPYNNRFEK